MKTRRFVWSDPELLAFARERFILFAGDDVQYRESNDKAKAEWQRLSAGTGGLPQQGMYAMSAAGEPLGYLNKGWPDPDPVAVLDAMRVSESKYRTLPDNRRKGTELAAGDRMVFEKDAFGKPAGTLDLRIVSRGLPFEGMTSFDQRHPMFFHWDRLWFKPSEWREFLPATLAPGSTTTVRGPGRTRLVLLSHHQAGHSAWWEEHIVGGETRSTVMRVEGDRVHLRLEADYRMRADSQWCKDKYDGRLIGQAVYDRSTDRFVRFDLSMLGTHTVGVRQANLHAGDLTSRIAVMAELNPTPDDPLPPQNWKYGYGDRWRQTP